VSVGDFGWVDRQGYLYIADRRVDMIISGGANVYPAEVESVLGQHPDVQDVAVIGLADHSWGRRVHAVVLPRDPTSPPLEKSLDEFCRSRLASFKVPKTYEFVDKLPRNEVGKLARGRLVKEREPSIAKQV
jgi:bile acid-coenzyme A ligase